jgi:hypothetical protein
MNSKPNAHKIKEMIEKSNEKWLNRQPRSVKTVAKANRINSFNIGLFGNEEKVRMGLLPPIYCEHDPIIEDT